MATNDIGGNWGGEDRPGGTADGPVSFARYTHVAMLLHWAIAALIIFNLALGYFMEGFPQPYRLIVIGLHVSSGMTVLALTIVRVAWRMRHKPPPLLPAAGWEHSLAHIVHVLLYAGMVLMPLTGWAIISAHPPASATWTGEKPRPMARVWGVVPLPRLGPVEAIGATPEGGERQKQLHDQLVDAHGIGGYIMIALLLLHVGGAFKHQFADRQPELERMGVGRRRLR